jgi:CBS domain-containing protein
MRGISPGSGEISHLDPPVSEGTGAARLLHRHRSEREEAAMRVYEVMSTGVETVKPDTQATEARNRMRQMKIHHLVVTKKNEIAGIVSERDLGGSKLPKVLGAKTVKDLMTTPVVTVTTRTPIRRAAALMKGRSIGALVVTSANGRVAGIVTVTDLLELMARTPEREFDKKRRMLRKLAEADED